MKFTSAVLLVEGAKDLFQAKTASALLRYRADDILYLLDSNNSGKNSKDIFELGNNTPVISSIKEAVGKADALIICMVLPEGKIPEKWIHEITTALKNNIDVINPLHINLGNLPQISDTLGGIHIESTNQVTRFNDTKVKIYNIRAVPDDLELFSLKVLNTRAKRILTVGSDCNIGKMLTTMELNRSAQRRGINSSFIATGQTGILLKGSGIAVDRVISDFVPGAVERLIVDEGDRDILFIEGQGSIFQPIYSSVTMGLIHGSAPHEMVLCDIPTRKKLRYTDIDVPDIKTQVRIHEEIASVINKSKVVGISLNCYDLGNDEATSIIKELEDITGLPTTDPVKFGVENIMDNININL